MPGRRLQLHVADMAAVAVAVKAPLCGHFIGCRGGMAGGQVKGIRVTALAGNSRDDPETLPVDPGEASGRALRRRRQQNKIEIIFLAELVAPPEHVVDDLQPQLLRPFILTVVLAGEQLQGFSQADKADGEGAVLDRLADLIVGGQVLRTQVELLPHQEGQIPQLQARNHPKAVDQLPGRQAQHPVQLHKKEFLPALAVQGQPGQVDRCRGDIAATGRNFGAVAVADNPAAAAHVGDLVAVFLVKGAVHEAESGVHPPRCHFQSQPVEVVVGVCRAEVNPLLDPEDQVGEDGALPASQAAPKGFQNSPGHRPSLGGAIGAQVDGAAGDLCSCTGVHGV